MSNASPPPIPDDAAQRVSAPATGMLVTGIIGAVFAILGLVMNLLGTGMGTMMSGGDAAEKYLQMMSGGIGIVSSLIGVAVAAFLIYTSKQMKKLTQWGMCLGASIVAMIPCISPCCIVGIPIGIWCLVILLKPEIKAAFH